MCLDEKLAAHLQDGGWLKQPVFEALQTDGGKRIDALVRLPLLLDTQGSHQSSCLQSCQLRINLADLRWTEEKCMRPFHLTGDVIAGSGCLRQHREDGVAKYRDVHELILSNAPLEEEGSTLACCAAHPSQ